MPFCVGGTEHEKLSMQTKPNPVFQLKFIEACVAAEGDITSYKQPNGPMAQRVSFLALLHMHYKSKRPSRCRKAFWFSDSLNPGSCIMWEPNAPCRRQVLPQAPSAETWTDLIFILKERSTRRHTFEQQGSNYLNTESFCEVPERTWTWISGSWVVGPLEAYQLR